MTAPGAAWELEQAEIRGLKLKVYKHAPPSIRAVWLASKVSETSIQLSIAS